MAGGSLPLATANNWTNLRISKADARKGSIKRGSARHFHHRGRILRGGIREEYVVTILIASSLSLFLSLSLGPRLPTIYRARCIVIGLQSGRNRVANYRADSKIHLQMIILLIEVPARRTGRCSTLRAFRQRPHNKRMKLDA